MKDTTSILSGELDPWPSKEHLSALLRSSGVAIKVGRQSIRIKACHHFIFQNIDACPMIDADAPSEQEMLRDAQVVSSALLIGGVRHRFEIYGANNQQIAYLHNQWPSAAQPVIQADR